MKIDIHVLALILSLTTFLQLAALFDRYWANKKNQSGLFWWMTGSALLTLGYLFNSLRDNLFFGQILIIVNNVLFVSSMAVIYIGVLRFFDKKERIGWLIAFCSFVVLISIYFSYFDNNLAVRRVNLSAAIAIMSFLIARALFLYKTYSVRFSAYFLLFVFLVYGFFFTVRAFTPFMVPVENIFAPTLTQTTTYLLSLIASTFWTIGFIIMSEQKNDHPASKNHKQSPVFKNHIWTMLIYFLLALITQSIFKTITVWPSAGLVVAAFIVFGMHIWPSIAAGTFFGVIAYFIEIGQPPFCFENIVINLITVIGNTVAGLLALRVCGRVYNLIESFGKIQWIINHFITAIFIFGIVSAIPGVGAYWLIGHPWKVGYINGVGSWFISNTVGAIVIAPIIISLKLTGIPWRQPLKQLKPHIMVTFFLLLLTLIIFGPGEYLLPAIFHQPFFLLIPLVFVAVRLSQKFTFFLLAFTFISVWAGNTMGYGPFFELHKEVSNASMQTFIGFSALVILIMQALLVEQRTIKEQWAYDLLKINRQLEQKVEERTSELRETNLKLYETNQKLEKLSITDGLTKIANRRHFDEVFGREYSRHIRSQADLSIILLDIDHFKAFNDNYGHLSGDDCLRKVARVIANCAKRPNDLAARYGGEEFVCILPETDSDGAVSVAKNIHVGVEALLIPHKGSKAAEHVTVSIGVVTAKCLKNISAEEIVAKADDMLYIAKSSGRNRVEFTSIFDSELSSVKEISGNLVQLVWKETFYSGNKIIDSQHRSLFQMFNEILEKTLYICPSMETSKIIAETSMIEEISTMITRLIEDIKKHFQDEEIILEKAGFPNFKEHAAEHSKLMSKAFKISHDFKSSVLLVGDVFQFLAYDIITMHMFKEDIAFFPFIKDKSF
ncbi:MAG: diguanylate cyclase [Desulfobacterales bacterium]|nr:diguanylate cyclase [Desulfobacterales bacterium]MBF0397578.1 diguanylate cyclase [Desulfobacterales bacterium]